MGLIATDDGDDQTANYLTQRVGHKHNYKFYATHFPYVIDNKHGVVEYLKIFASDKFIFIGTCTGGDNRQISSLNLMFFNYMRSLLNVTVWIEKFEGRQVLYALP